MTYPDKFVVRDTTLHGDLFALRLGAPVPAHMLSAFRSDDLTIDDSVNAYNERAFRYLLSIEQKRFDRSGLPFALVLVDLRDALGVGMQMPREVAEGVFATLSRGFRETDFAGWYRESEVAGAVLTACGPNTAEVVRGRLTDLLSEHVDDTVWGHLQIRVVELPGQTHEVAGNRSELCP